MMAANLFGFKDEFFGSGSLQASPGGGDRWDVTDTSSSGTPTYAYATNVETGGLSLAHSSTSEAQNVCLSFGDTLSMDIDRLRSVKCRVKLSQATFDSASSLAIGVASARNDDIDTIAEQALFRLVGSTAIVAETDDGSVNRDDIATGTTLSQDIATLCISFASGTSDVRFYVGIGDGGLKRVCRGTTFDMSSYSGSLQPYIQLQKTSDSNADGVLIDMYEIIGAK